MKVVLRHKKTGRYYHSPGQWVRRADNALTFSDVQAAQEFSRRKHLRDAQPVQRLAPYLMLLIGKRRQSVWQGRMNRQWGHEFAGSPNRFNRN